MEATVSGGASVLKYGASPMFSTDSPSTPPDSRADASSSAASTTGSSSPPNRGEPGSGSNAIDPMTGRSAPNSSRKRTALIMAGAVDGRHREPCRPPCVSS